jgi:drug/metabolite transporter (DMT)-like permease
VAYRIGIAAAILFGWALFKKLPLRFSLKNHLFMILQGALIFSTNFFLFYLAAAHLTTGLIAVIFSTASAMTILLNALLYRRKPSGSICWGAVLGVVGIGIIFQHQLAEFSFQSGEGLGLLLSLAGTFCFSLGSIVSSRNRMAGLPLCGNMSWAMLYGSLLLCIFVVLRGKHFTFDFSLSYIASLIYLAIVASVIAFAAYFALLSRISTEQAAYTTVLLPIVALTLSTFFEGYQWTISIVLGLMLTIAGNILVLRHPLKNVC